MDAKKNVVQIKNPRTGHYVKIDREQGRIISHKKSDGPLQGRTCYQKEEGRLIYDPVKNENTIKLKNLFCNSITTSLSIKCVFPTQCYNDNK